MPNPQGYMCPASSNRLKSILADNGLDIRHRMEIYGGLASTYDRFQIMMERNGRRVKWRRQTSHLNDHHRSCHKFHNTESIYRRSSGNPPYHKESVAFMVVGMQSGKTSTHSMGKRKKGKQSMSESISVHNDPSEVQHTWQFNQWFSRYHSHFMSFGFSSACANRHRIDGNNTLICSKIKPELGCINIRDGYITMGLRSALITVSF